MSDSKRTKPKQKASETDKGRRHELALKLVDLAETLGRALLWGVVIVLALYVGVALPIQYSAGKTTSISYILNWISDFKVAFPVAAASGCAGWAIIERRMRYKERKEKDERISKLEEQLDPNRSSSQLTPEGSPTRE